MRAFLASDPQMSMQNGENARLKILSGPAQGSLFILMSDRARVGRGDDSDVCIVDQKASKHHLAIQKFTKGWVIQDLKSANGVYLNNKKIEKSYIYSGNKFSFGETIVEFWDSKDYAKILNNESIDPIKNEQRLQNRIQAIQSLGGKKNKSDPKHGKPSYVLWIALIGAGIYFWTDTDVKPKTENFTKNEKSSISIKRNLAFDENQIQSVEVKRFFALGFREYREKNYFRAKKFFETALQIDPTHKESNDFLKNTEKSIQTEAEDLLILGKKAFESGKLKEAKSHFTSVKLFLNFDINHPSYMTAEKYLIDIDKIFKGLAI